MKQNKTPQDIDEIKPFLNHVFFVSDKNLNHEVKQEKESDDIHIKLLTTINESSHENHKQKRKLKPIFFWIVMLMYIVVILGSIATIIVIPLCCTNWYVGVPSVFASIAAIITALIKIPSIIAEYLFPKEEDNILLKLSQNVFRHDEILKRNSKRLNQKNKKQ